MLHLALAWTHHFIRPTSYHPGQEHACHSGVVAQNPYFRLFLLANLAAFSETDTTILATFVMQLGKLPATNRFSQCKRLGNFYP